MKDYVTETRNAKVIDLPFGCPQTELRRGDSLVIAVFKLATAQKLTFKVLQLTLVRVLTAGSPSPVATELGLIYVGLYGGGFGVDRPAGMPMAYLSLNGPGTSVMNPGAPVVAAAKDTYELVAVNNTSNMDYDISVVGSAGLVLE